MNKLVCESCGSANIEMKCWCDPNTGKITDGDSCIEKDDCWCNDCGKHVYFTGLELEQEKYQWHDADDCLPEENVYVVCRYDDYYFIGYIEDGRWYNHSAADTILETDAAKVEYWKMFQCPHRRD